MESIFLDALNFKNTERAPVWIMRQAGRYLPSYQKIKQKHSLIEMFHSKEIIEEVTLLPIHQFGFDAAILFSDILIILEVLGFSITFETGLGPQVFPKIRSEEDISNICVKPVEETLFFVFEAIKSLKRELQVPLIGFCGGPFTVLSYLLDSEKADKLKNVKHWIYTKPNLVIRLLEMLTACTKQYLYHQIKAGVDSIQIFDSWAGFLPKDLFSIFAKPYLKELVDFVKKQNIPVTIFSRNTSLYFEDFYELEPTGISCDGMKSIVDIKDSLSKPFVLQGDLDPELLLYGPIPLIEKKTKHILSAMSGYKGFIFNLGHGVLPKTPMEHMQALVDTVKAFSPSVSFTK